MSTIRSCVILFDKFYWDVQFSFQDYYELANSHCYRTPVHSDYDNLERKYWKSLSFVPPIYGCDVAANLTDPEQDVWNIARLGSILDTIKEDSEIDIQVSSNLEAGVNPLTCITAGIQIQESTNTELFLFWYSHVKKRLILE